MLSWESESHVKGLKTRKRMLLDSGPDLFARYSRMFFITEAGLDAEYAFESKPIRVNGKSGEACRKVNGDNP